MRDVTLDAAVRPSDDCMARVLDGESVILNLQSSSYFGLDPVGTRIWQLLEQHGRLALVLEELVKEYDAPADTIARDLVELVTEMLQQGLVVRADG
jgi:hypothetical protein